MKKFFSSLVLTLMVALSANAAWDYTVTTSLDGKTVTSLADFEGMTITFNGAESIELVDAEDFGGITIGDATGTNIYGVWATVGYGSTCTIEGNVVTLSKISTDGCDEIPAGTTKLYLEDYGCFRIDGKAKYFDTVELNANIGSAAAQPFMLTSVTNNGVAGSIVAVEAAENGMSYSFEVTAATGLDKGTGVPTLTLNGVEKFGAADVLATGNNTAYIRFMDLQKSLFTDPGQYILTIPEGTFVDENGTPNAAATAVWVIIENDGPIVINDVTLGEVTVEMVKNERTGEAEQHYTTSLNFTVPEKLVGKCVYTMGFELVGERSPFMIPDEALNEMGAFDITSTSVVIPLRDGTVAGTSRKPGTYTAKCTLGFIDMETEDELGEANFTGSIVLPNIATVTLGTPVFNVQDSEVVSLTDLEANGLSLIFDDAEGITPDMSITVVADLYTMVPQFGMGGDEVDPGYTMPEFQTVLSDISFVGTTDLGAPSVAFTDFLQYVMEAGAGAYGIQVKSITVFTSAGSLATWNMGDETEFTGNVAFVVEEKPVITNVTAKVGATEPNAWGDQFYTVTLTVPADELDGTGAALAFTEGVIFEAVGADGFAQMFTFNAVNGEGTEIVEGEDLAIVCKDSMAGYTTDETFDGELRAEGTYTAMANIVLADEMGKEMGYVEYRGELTLIKDVYTGITTAKFNVTNVTYNIAGQRVNNAKGLVIKNGKKCVVK